MTTISVAYDVARNALYVSGILQPFPAGSLQARQSGDMLAVANPYEVSGQDLVCAWLPFSEWTIEGAVYTDAASAFVALSDVCTRKRSVGEAFGVAAVAGTNLVRGQPVAVSRVSGQLFPARADSYVLSFVAGLASADTAKGFTNQPAHGAVTLPDWTAQTGSPSLSVGQPYFLGRSGGLTTTPDFSVACVARVGAAVSPQTLIVDPTDPILL